MKNRLYALLFCLLSALWLMGCQSDSTDAGSAALPRTFTAEPIHVMATSFDTGGHVTSDGNSDISDRGVCWATTPAPTVKDNKMSSGSGRGTFECRVTGLTRNTTYYVRAYATNNIGTSYGEEFSVTTLDPRLATVATSPVTGAYGATAYCGGDISDNGNAEITERGVCWNTDPEPTIANDRTSDGTGTGTFTSTLTGLVPGQTYFVRAYATNEAGTAYGEAVEFRTEAPTAPTVATMAITNITTKSAESGGIITRDGGAVITARGICWSASGTPTTDDAKTSDGTGDGEFTSVMTDLTAGKLYRVRAYATNAVGTSYGEELLFTPQYVDDGLDMIEVPAGRFTMGSALGNYSAPSFEVSLPAFYFSRVETTQKLWVEIMGSNPTNTAAPCPIGDYYPVSNIMWREAVVFCNKLSIAKGLQPCYSIAGETDPDRWELATLEADVVCDWQAGGYRLPNEAEWEYVAGGGAADRTIYPGTNDFEQVKLYGWIEGNTDPNNNALHEVATRFPNQLGVFDLSGNVSEFCWDWNNAYTAESKVYPDEIPARGGSNDKVRRGASIWNWSGNAYMIYSRFGQPVSELAWPTGMRLARTKTE